jgi:hypothetical protein
MPTAHAAYSWDLSASVAFGCHMRRRAKDEHKLSLAGVGRRSEHQPGLTEELPNVEYFYVLSNFSAFDLHIAYTQAAYAVPVRGILLV